MSIGPWDRDSGLPVPLPIANPAPPDVVPHKSIRGIDRTPEEVLKPPVKPDPA